MKEQFGGHSSINDMYSFDICQVSVMQKMSRLFVVKKSLRRNDEFVMERAFSNAILSVLGPRGSGSGCGW